MFRSVCLSVLCALHAAALGSSCLRSIRCPRSIPGGPQVGPKAPKRAPKGTPKEDNSLCIFLYMSVYVCAFLYISVQVHPCARFRRNPQFCGARGGVDARFRIYAQNAAEWWCRHLEWCSLKAFCSQVKIRPKGRNSAEPEEVSMQCYGNRARHARLRKASSICQHAHSNFPKIIPERCPESGNLTFRK